MSEFSQTSETENAAEGIAFTATAWQRVSLHPELVVTTRHTL
jgi:hypothetical protein